MIKNHPLTTMSLINSCDSNCRCLWCEWSIDLYFSEFYWDCEMHDEIYSYFLPVERATLDLKNLFEDHVDEFQTNDLPHVIAACFDACKMRSELLGALKKCSAEALEHIAHIITFRDEEDAERVFNFKANHPLEFDMMRPYLIKSADRHKQDYLFSTLND